MAGVVNAWSVPLGTRNLQKDNWIIGLSVELLLVNQEKVVGEIYAYVNSSKLLIIKESSNHGDQVQPSHKGKFRLIARDFIKTTTYVGGTGHAPESLPRVDIEKAREIERRKLHKSRQEAIRLNPGATPIGQELFNRLSKTYPVQWGQDNTIVVLGSVIISSPYTSENCKGTGDSYHRIKRV
eukprot:Ihof_evm2s528 gene=Ihof_evmTU2s528